MPVPMSVQWIDRKAKVKPGQKRAEFFDEEVAGLLLRVTETGKRTWYVFYRVKGQGVARRRMLIGEYPGITLSEARRRARSILDDAAVGIDRGAEKQLADGVITFQALADEYLEKWAEVRKKERSAKEDARILKKDVLPKWKRRKINQIKRRDVIELLDAVNARGLQVHANRVLALVRKIFNWAISRDLLEANPCAQVQAPCQEVQRDRVLSEDEIKKFWAACDRLQPVVAASFRMRLVTAQRGGEVQHMRWADLDLESGWWTIPAEFAKNGLAHRVPLSPLALSLLDEIKELTKAKKSEWVFPSRMVKDKPLSNPSHSGKLARTYSGVEFELHDLRRTAASHMASMGVQRLVLSKILNHVETGVTAVYDRHSYDQEKRQALDVWAERLIEILK